MMVCARIEASCNCELLQLRKAKFLTGLVLFSVCLVLHLVESDNIQYNYYNYCYVCVYVIDIFQHI